MMRKKLVLIRVDAGEKMGTGHMMRCIALGQAWQERGGDIAFLTHCDSVPLCQRILDEGFEIIKVEKPHPDAYDLGFTLERVEQMKRENSKLETWVVLDGYHFTSDYQRAIREKGYRLLVIDDMNHLEYYHADILLNQNINAASLAYSCRRDTVKLLGSEYVLLRNEFLKYKDWKRTIPKDARNVLVTLGGTDSNNVTSKVITALNNLSGYKLVVKCIVGAANQNIRCLEKALIHSPFSSEILTDVRIMPELMKWADIAISSAGSTCWEMAFMGLPNFIITLADNQVGIANELAKVGAAIDLGWYENMSISQCSKAIKDILKDKNKRSCLSDHGKTMINGKGKQKVISVMFAGQIRLRKALETDCELLWKWANDPKVRQAAFNSGPIEWTVHQKWFEGKLSNPNCIQYIAVNNKGIPVGQIRFDIVDNIKANIDYSVDRQYRGSGVGTSLLQTGIKSVRTELDKSIIIQGKVKKNNHRSIRIFRKMGFDERLKCSDKRHPANMNNAVYIYTMAVR